MLSVIVLAAGKGQRMKSNLPKVVHIIGGKPLYQYAVDTAHDINAQSVYLVVSPTVEKHLKNFDGLTKVMQEQAKGTGDAVRQCLPYLEDKDDTHQILILLGDLPLLQSANIQKFVSFYGTLPTHSILVGGMDCPYENSYGKIVLEENEPIRIKKIVEDKDCTPSEKEITLCNSGIILTTIQNLKTLLPKLSSNNASQEYYLTDIMSLGNNHGIQSYVYHLPHDECQGINTRIDLSKAEEILQDRWREQAMLNGVTLQDPKTTFLSHDTILESDVTIEPNVYFGTGVHIKANCRIKAFSHIESSVISEGSTIGPFARLRGHCDIGPKSDIGNFVEAKNLKTSEGVKIKHLSYLGDATVGTSTNIGAGTITCNYDGKNKHKTTIGEKVFIGSNTAIIAPVTIEDESLIAAGSVITQDVPKSHLAIARSYQTNKLKKV